MSDSEWDRDTSPYAGNAAHNVRGRVPYPQPLIDAAIAALVLDGRGRLSTSVADIRQPS
ncbi:hypothetical protein [Amnibacterium sp.]|uniref:hypothetical protein n=1 Tax=Amnibacterium sp. TaxID=1872496 RepID=UPI00262A6098|nr:hypothetical protein [Amnibacterium sp.]MCU1472769.1 hypothetical protein [Amnibacterium sp.]